jgi:hypothetical protein
MRERRVDMLHRLHAGGVRMATGIDAGIGPWVAGNFHRGVSQLEDASFSPVPGVASQGGARASQPSVPIYAISGRERLGTGVPRGYCTLGCVPALAVGQRLIPDGNRHSLRLDRGGCRTPSDASLLNHTVLEWPMNVAL